MEVSEVVSEDIVCDKHGKMKREYFVFNGVKIARGCPLCAEERERKACEQEEERLVAEKKSRWTLSNVREKFFGLTMNDFLTDTDSQKEAARAILKIMNGENKSVVLCGNNGTGKTMLASIAVMSRGGYIYKMYEIVIRIKSSYKSGAKEDEKDILDALSRAPLLAIDEVGKQFGSESERNWLSYVVDERYERNLPTILISNLKPKKWCSEEEVSEGLYLERYLGKDTVSRLSETADIILLDGEDFRRKGLTKKH